MGRSEARATVEALTVQATADLDALWTRLLAEQQALIDKWPGRPPTARQRALRGLVAGAEAATRDARRIIAATVPRTASAAARAGGRDAVASVGLQLLDVDPDLVASFSRDMFRDLLGGARGMTDTTREWVQLAARGATQDSLFAGRTATQAATALRKQLEQSGLAAVVYRDGSRHGLTEYSRMVVRTKTAELYALAELDQLQRHGIRWVELLDNPSCGLTSHDDEEKANGMIVTTTRAASHPTSHPNCVRAIQGRPDVANAADARTAGKTTTEEQDQDQRLVETVRAVDPVTPAAQARFEARVARTDSGTLDTSSDLSPAAARAQSRVARAAARAVQGTRTARYAGPVPTPGSYATPETSLAVQTAAQEAADRWFRRRQTSRAYDEWTGYQMAGGANNYRDVNGDLRGGGPEAAARRKVWAKVAEAGIDTPEPIVLHRGLLASAGEDYRDRFTVGEELVDAGVMSTTASRGIARGWLSDYFRDNPAVEGSVLLEVRVPAGTRVVGGGLRTFETMLMPGTRMRVVEVRDDPPVAGYAGAVRSVVLEVLP